MGNHDDALFRLYAISAEINSLIKKLLDEEYLLHDKEKWVCKLCNKSTYETEYDYLAARNVHLECALKEEIKLKEEKKKMMLDYICGDEEKASHDIDADKIKIVNSKSEPPYKKWENTNDEYRLGN